MGNKAEARFEFIQERAEFAERRRCWTCDGGVRGRFKACPASVARRGTRAVSGCCCSRISIRDDVRRCGHHKLARPGTRPGRPIADDPAAIIDARTIRSAIRCAAPDCPPRRMRATRRGPRSPAATRRRSWLAGCRRWRSLRCSRSRTHSLDLLVRDALAAIQRRIARLMPAICHSLTSTYSAMASAARKERLRPVLLASFSSRFLTAASTRTVNVADDMHLPM